MYCIYCGQELPADALYCSHCGRKVQSIASIQSTTPLQNRTDETEDKVVKMAVYTNEPPTNSYTKELSTKPEDSGDTEIPDPDIFGSIIVIIVFVIIAAIVVVAVVEASLKEW